MSLPRSLGLGGLSALFTLLALCLLQAWQGGEMFSPGALSARVSPTRSPAAGASHAAFAGQCSACHVPPWSGQTMARKCVDCHDEIRAQIESRTALHGRVQNSRSCLACHTEHQGSDAEITSFHAFHHDDTDFPLTGRHLGLACARCHPNGSASHQSASTACADCHAEPASHAEEVFGQNCADCHNTTSWRAASFAHTFPIDHEKAMRRIGCAACHDPGRPKADYTCYNCHKHDKDKERARHAKWKPDNIDRCADCHPTGKKAAARK